MQIQSRELNQMKRREILRRLSDERLTFQNFFLLIPEINALRLVPYLAPDRGVALQIVKEINDPQNKVNYLFARSAAAHKALLWMLARSGQELLRHDYEKVMEIAASVLIDAYEEKRVLPAACDMIFSRGKKGRNIHNLTWAYFRSQTLSAVREVAERLRSEDQEEAALARRLLHIRAGGQHDRESRQRLYEIYSDWLAENEPYLFFTGESFQYTGEPAAIAVDLAKKRSEKRVKI